MKQLKKMGYLVSKVPPMSVPYKDSELEKLDSQILDKIRSLQFESPADTSKFLIVGSSEGSGVGSALLAMITKGLRLGYLYNRTTLYDKTNLAYDFCFKPIGIHSLQSMNLKTDEQVHFNFLPQKEKVVNFEPWNSMEWAIESESNMLIKYGIRLSEINYAAPLQQLPYSELYVNGLLMDSFLKLKEEYEEHIENRKREMGFEYPIIGLHVRQGDVYDVTYTSTNYRKHPVENFFEAVEQIASRTNIKTVFVTTDSEKSIRQLPKDSGLTFIYDDREERYDNLNVEMVKKMPELRKQETMTAIKNIYLLSDCDYIIGIYGHFFTYSVSLSYYRNKKLNGILMRRKGDTGFALEYIVTDDDKLAASTSPVEPTQSSEKQGSIPWLR